VVARPSVQGRDEGSTWWLLVFPSLWPQKDSCRVTSIVFFLGAVSKHTQIAGLAMPCTPFLIICFYRAKSAVRSHVPMMCYFAKPPDSSQSFLPAPATWQIKPAGRLCNFWKGTTNQHWDLKLGKWNFPFAIDQTSHSKSILTFFLECVGHDLCAVLVTKYCWNRFSML
jgi:hypothetical protein